MRTFSIQGVCILRHNFCLSQTSTATHCAFHIVSRPRIFINSVDENQYKSCPILLRQSVTYFVVSAAMSTQCLTSIMQ